MDFENQIYFNEDKWLILNEWIIEGIVFNPHDFTFPALDKDLLNPTFGTHMSLDFNVNLKLVQLSVCYLVSALRF